jgi:uncharacterized membrane protein
MINIEVSTVINRPIADVFAFVANFENHPRWAIDFMEVKQLTSTTSGVGTTYNCLLKFPGQIATSKFEITEFVLNQKIAYKGETAGPAKYKGCFLFESVPGGAKVTSLPQPEFRGLFKLLQPIMSGYIRKNNVAYLNTLQRLLEG